MWMCVYMQAANARCLRWAAASYCALVEYAKYMVANCARECAAAQLQADSAG